MSHEPQSTRFADQVKAIPNGEHLELCYSCGTCTSKCMVQRKLEPEYNPRRLLRMVVMDLRDDAFDSPTIWLCTECDLCYSACPQKIHISGVLAAVRGLAVQAGRTRPNEPSHYQPARVNQQTCVACCLCVEVCPYKAVRLVEKKVPYRGQIPVAEVDPTLCMACGSCGAVCRSASIGIGEAYADELMVNGLWEWLKR